MPQRMAGPGVSLPAPQLLFPASLVGAPVTAPTYEVGLAAGQALIVPAGCWIASWPSTCMLQWLDGWVTGEWINFNAVYPINSSSTTGAAGVNAGVSAQGYEYFQSDGVNVRIANLTGSAFGATVSAAGTLYVQATTTVTAGTGNSTWMPVVGGALGTFTVTAGGAGYSMPPIVLIARPPSPGVPATAQAVLTAGVVTSITIQDAGAGYLTPPVVTIIPNQFDPNYLSGAITANATATVALTGAGTLTAVLLQNFGQSLAAAPTLTVNGAGSAATVVTAPSTFLAQAFARVILTQMPG
jgi:hypothetical protein